MQIGSLGGNFDVAEVVLATFVLFFVGLVIYIQRESNREGFPLVSDEGKRLNSGSLFGIPKPKLYRLPNGKELWLPRAEPQEILPSHEGSTAFGGAMTPVGNMLLSGLGAAAYARRSDVPDSIFFDGTARIVPLRADERYSIALEGPDPRGFAVAGADRVVAGRVVEIWIDRSETVARYLEIALTPAFGGRTVLAPMTMVDVQDGLVVVESIIAAQFGYVPGIKSPNEISALEEDQITAYYAAGTLFATPARSEPFL
jgi:photosynthetic reaction center H subunit